MNSSAEESSLPLWALSIKTYRNSAFGSGGDRYFPYECLIAGISVFFCRITVSSHKGEPLLLRLFCALALAFLAYSKKSYEIICSVQMLSYAVPVILTCEYKKIAPFVSKAVPEKIVQLVLIALSALVLPVLCRFLSSSACFQLLALLTPRLVKDAVFALFPIEEVRQAYAVVAAFLEPEVLQKHISHLLFVTFNCQVAMGYLGINFLKREQGRRNELIRMELVGVTDTGQNGTPSATEARNSKDSTVRQKQLEASKQFRRSAAPFILGVAVPYMAQIIAIGNMNMFAFSCLKDEVHRELRVNQLFENDAHLTAMSEDSATSPASYAASMDTVISTTYDIFNRKLFSLPKLMLLPGIVMKQPVLLAKIFPFIFASDFIKGRVVAFMTSTIEQLQKRSKEIDAIRLKVELYDMKNAELIRRSGQGAMQFTQHQWDNLTANIQQMQIMSNLLSRTKGFFQWLQRNFIFSVLIDCALANLIAFGRIVSAEVFVFSRAIEDAVDLVLMRSRAESELARMMTEIERLHQLTNVWEKSKERSLLPCHVRPPEESSLGITIRHLQYSRGTAMVTVEHIELPAGVYALTGSNGSGKSTLFRLLMSCDSNEKSIDLPESIMLLTPEPPPISDEDLMEDACKADDESHELEPEPEKDEPMIPTVSITMPSSDVAEISQSFYWPLFSRPGDWMYQSNLLDMDGSRRESMIRRAAEELQSLEFIKPIQPLDDKSSPETEESVVPPANQTLDKIMSDLQEEKEDWLGELSGGQKSKVELVRKVFLHDECPKVLLIDETMAPLDPTSKSLVMSKLKSFCRESVVIVIYHTDVGAGGPAVDGEGSRIVECVPSNDFFDDNIHVENHVLMRRPVC